MSEFIGWRTWNAYIGHGSVLHSPWRVKSLQRTPLALWEKRYKHAECIRRRLPCKESPGVSCTCGIGVIPVYEDLCERFRVFSHMNDKRPAERHLYLTRPVIVVGRVKAYGTVRDGGHKQPQNMDVAELRVESAKILELWVPGEPTRHLEDLAESFTHRYRVPAHLGFPEPRTDPLPPDVQALTDQWRTAVRNSPRDKIPTPPHQEA